MPRARARQRDSERPSLINLHERGQRLAFWSAHENERGLARRCTSITSRAPRRPRPSFVRRAPIALGNDLSLQLLRPSATPTSPRKLLHPAPADTRRSAPGIERGIIRRPLSSQPRWRCLRRMSQIASHPGAHTCPRGRGNRYPWLTEFEIEPRPLLAMPLCLGRNTLRRSCQTAGTRSTEGELFWVGEAERTR
jgi:hypothetical protein